MLALIAPLFFLTAGLLVIAGVGKAWRPRPTAQALYAAGFPGSGPAVRALGMTEIAVGVTALTRPAAWNAAMVALLYLAFAGFVTFLLVARPTASSCGCSGSRDTPPSWLHVSMDLAAASVAMIAAVAGTPSLQTAARSLGALSFPVALGLLATGWLAVVVATELPASLSAWTPPTHHEQSTLDPDRHRRADVALSTAGVDAGHASLWPDHDPLTGEPLGQQLDEPQAGHLEGVDVGH